jgi:hypothetical protein
MTVWIICVDTSVAINVDTSKQLSHRDRLKVFANVEATEQWFRKNGYPDLSASEYEIEDFEQSDLNIIGCKSVWIYVDSRKRRGNRNHLKVFVDLKAAKKWFAENDPKGVAFEYPVIGAGEE